MIISRRFLDYNSDNCFELIDIETNEMFNNNNHNNITWWILDSGASINITKF